MSRIYAGGVEATALANIEADLEDYFSYNDNGGLVLDTDGLKAYMHAELADIIADAEFVPPADANSATLAAQSAPIGAMVSALDAAINVGRWSQRGDWPTGAEVLSGGTMVAAVMAAFTECKRRADDITNYFYAANEKLGDILTDVYAELGIDAVVPAGVVRDIRTRAITYTYVSDRSEESAPSPPSELFELDQNDVATYTAAAPPVGRHVISVRWYRSQNTNSGSADPFFAGEKLLVDGLTFEDTAKDEELGEPCPTLTWIEPPANLQGIVKGSNGMLAGFFDNEFCVSEATVPYAWPEEYRKSLSWPIVGIGTFDQTFVVLTRGKPVYIEGADSQSLSERVIDSNQVCVSRRSIVSVEGGVIFASADGLCMATAGGIRVITEPFHTRKQWWSLSPASMVGSEVDGVYIATYGEETQACFAFDYRNGKLVNLDITPSAFYRDLITDTLYVTDGTAIKALFADNDSRFGTWKSKKVVADKPENFAWLQVDSDFFEGSVTVKLYRDGVLTDTNVLESREPVRLRAVRAIEHEVEVTGNQIVTGVTIAGSTDELKQL